MYAKEDGKQHVTESLLENKSHSIEATQVTPSNLEESRENDSDCLQRDIALQQLESSLELKLRKKSHYVIYATTFITSIGFSVVLTGIWPYLKELEPSASKEFLGWVVALNPLGQMIASPLVGWMASRSGSNRNSLLVTITMYVAGNLLYAVLPLFQTYAMYLMLLSRFIVGISSANIALCRSYISVSTLVKERTVGLTIVAAAQSMGYILGPSIQTALAYIFPLNPVRDSHAFSNVTYDDAASTTLLSTFNMYSLTGWFTAVLGFLNFFLLLPCVYKECNIAAKEELQMVTDNPSDTERVKTDFGAVFVLLFAYFSILLIYVLLETLIVPMCLDLYAWTAEFTVKVVGIGLTVAGVITFFMFILGGKLAKKYGDRKVFIICGLIPITFSLVLFFPIAGETPVMKHCPPSIHNSSVEDPHPHANSTLVLHTLPHFNFSVETTAARVRRAAILEKEESECHALGCPPSQEWCTYTPIIHIPQMIVASTLITIGYPIGISLSGAIFSKMLKVKRQGLWMGILTSAGSLSRFLGPIFVSYLYTAKGPLWTFVTLFILFLFVIILAIIFYKRMQPLSNRLPQNRS